MAVELTRPGKHSLIIDSPVMTAAGTFGFGDRYNKLIKTEKLGAVVTDPVTIKPRKVAKPPNVIPVSGGLLLHTGMPNPGVKRVIDLYEKNWASLDVPVIVHVMATTPPDVGRCARALDPLTGIVAGIELGIHYQASADEVREMVRAVMSATLLPLLVRLPMERAVELAPAVARSDAGGLVIAAPPRGVARDPLSGRLVSGRVFGPLVKALALRAVGMVLQELGEGEIPVIGAGGIHSPDDARDFIEEGARAVQLDSVIWVRPRMAEVIARNLGGLELTRVSWAFPDEWFPGMGVTDIQDAIPPMPKDLPE